MAVLRYNDTSATAFAGSTGTSFTSASFDAGSGSNRALAVGLSYLWGGTAGTLTVTYGGVTLSAIAGTTFTDADGVTSIIYGITATGGLPTGSNTLTVSGTQAFYLNVNLLAVTGADQTGGTTTFAHATGGTGNAGNPSVTVTSATGNLVFALGSGFPGTFSGVVSPGTLIGTTQNVGITSAAQYANGAATVATSETMSSGNWSTAAVDIVAAATASVTGLGGIAELFAPTLGPDWRPRGFQPRLAFSSTPISVTLAATEIQDTAAFNGSVLVSGTLAVTENTDTAAFNGFVGVSGSLAVTETTDVAIFNGDVVNSGTLAVTEGTDTAAFNGSVIVSGTLAVTENTDTAVFNGTVGNVISGTLVVTESADVAVFAGDVIVSGPLVATETADIAAFSGSVVVSGTLVVTETQDIAAFAGSVVSAVTGTLAVTEAPDIALFLEQMAVGGKHWTLKDGREHKPHKHWTEKSLPLQYKASSLPGDVQVAAAAMSKLGGHARAAALTPKRRTQIATIAAKARWK